MNIGGIDDFDKDLFKTHDVSMFIAMKLSKLLNPNSKEQPTCTEITNSFMVAPWYMMSPKIVFRDSLL